MARLLACSALISAMTLAPDTGRAQDGPFVYVPNHADDNLSLIDSSTDTVQPGTIAAGDGPYSVAVRGDQALVYVANDNSNTVSVIDTATNTVVATINVGNAPNVVTVSPDGRRAYVSNRLDDSVSVIDTTTNTVLTTVTVGPGPYGVGVSPDGDTVYVANTNGTTVSVINAASNMVTTTINVGNSPYSIAFSPDGSRAYVSNFDDGSVSVIDTASNTVTTTINLGVGVVYGVAVSPDGSRVYVAYAGAQSVAVIDTATNMVTTTIPVGVSVSGIAVSPDGSRVYAVNTVDKTVSVIDTATNMVIDTLPVGKVPILPGICGNGNALLTAGNTFIAKSAGAIACTGAAGPVFTGGTLQIDTASLTSALPMTLGAAGGTIDTQANTATFSGAIAGSGGLTKTGSGTLILSGANTYNGATNINQGTLQAGAANTFSPFSAFSVAGGAVLDLNSFNQTIGSLAGAGNVLLGSGVLTAGGDNTSTTFSGVMSGSGGLTKTGSGTLILSGANTYSGGTTLNAGALTVGNNNALGSGTLSMAPGTILSFLNTGNFTVGNNIEISGDPTFIPPAGTTQTIAGVISDGSSPGILEMSGAGTLALTGSNTYSGGTNINQGTLQAGNDSALGSGPVTVNSGATLDVHGQNLTIGSLADGSGGGGSVDSNTAAGSLTTGGDNSSTTFSGVLGDGSGQLALTKIGTGTFTLSGTNTYTGPTTVNVGLLSVNGSIASSSLLTVNSGGSVGGSGNLPSTTINGGTLAPGNSIGTITVNGNLTFNGGSTYAVEVSPSDADRTNVTGSATLAGMVNATFASGSYLTRSYTILSATGGLGGTQFNTLTTSNAPAGFTTRLSYTDTDVTLDLAAVLGFGGGLNGNQQNVATALNNYFNGGGALPPAFVTLFGLTGNNLSNALSQVSGEVATGAQGDAFQLMDQFLGLMFEPYPDYGSGGSTPVSARAFADEQPSGFPSEVKQAYAAVFKAPPQQRAPGYEQRWRAWGSGYGGYNATNGDAVIGSHDVSGHIYGGAAGLDYRLTPDTVIGLALGGAGTDWGLSEGLGTGRSDAFQAGLYARTYDGPAYLAGALAFANHWMSTDRYAAFGDHLTASFDAQSYGGRIEGGYRIGTVMQAITPYAAVQAQSYHSPDYNETDATGGGFALAYASRSASDTRSELGARFDTRMAVAGNAVLRLSARAAWAHDWVSDPSLTATFQTLPGASFVVDGAVPAEDSALVSAAARLRLASGVSLQAKFDGDFAGGSQTYAGTATLRFTW